MGCQSRTTRSFRGTSQFGGGSPFGYFTSGFWASTFGCLTSIKFATGSCLNLSPIITRRRSSYTEWLDSSQVFMSFSFFCMSLAWRIPSKSPIGMRNIMPLLFGLCSSPFWFCQFPLSRTKAATMCLKWWLTALCLHSEEWLSKTLLPF